MSKKKIIIFDLGNVLINVRLNPFNNFLKELGVEKDEKLVKTISILNTEFNLGLINGETYYESFKKKYSKQLEKISLAEFKNAWCSIFSLNKSVYDFAKHLDTEKAVLYLASNTDPWHFSEIIKRYDLSFIPKNHHYLSYEHNLMKPDIKYFRKLRKLYNFEDSKKIIFIDDLKENCQAAELAGIPAFCNTDNLITINFLKNFINVS